MDLLYFLQTVRLALPDWINIVFILISESVLLFAPLIAACTYWCADRKKGVYIICAFCFALLANELTKLTCCVYRPWILDPRLSPAPQVIGTATNYSFPSSHSCSAAVIWISLALAFPERKGLRIAAVVVPLLVMFARMYLGCHTLTDVCCGAAIGTASAFFFRPMLKEDFDESRFIRILLPVSWALAGISVLYIILKSYPLDYQADGSLLVDPTAMYPDTFGSCGILAGVGTGLFLERKLICFELPADRKKALSRALLGSALFTILYVLVFKAVFGFLDPSPAKFLRYFFCVLFICAGFPAMFRRLDFL